MFSKAAFRPANFYCFLGAELAREENGDIPKELSMTWRDIRGFCADASIVLVVLCFLGASEPARAEAPVDPDCSPKVFRFEEDCRGLAEYVGQLTGTDVLRYMPLTQDGDLWLTIGAEYRAKVETLDEPNFGIGKGDMRYTAHGQRLYANVDLRSTGGERIFVQLSAASESGRKPAERTFDRSDPDIQQAFVDVPLPMLPVSTFLRLGRQEFDFGGNRLISTRDPAGLQRSFDMARLETKPFGVDWVTFYGRVVNTKQSWFDDTSNDSDRVYGSIATFRPRFYGDLASIQLYYMEHEREVGIYQAGKGRDRHQATGMRFAGVHGNFNLAVQGTYQFGAVALDRVTGANGVSVELGYSLPSVLWSPHADFIVGRTSGDKRPNDGKLNDYDPFYPNLNYYTDAPELYPVNLTDFNPSVTLNFAHWLNLRVGADFVFRTSKFDGVYAASGIAFATGNGTGSSYVTSLAYSHLTYLPLDHVQLDFGVVYGFIGDYLRDMPGARNLTYGQFKATYKF